MNRKDQWNARYAGDDLLFGDRPNAFLERNGMLLRPGMRALAVADGEGRNGVWLAEQGLDVLAIDISDLAQAKAARLAETRCVQLELRLADLTAWEWPAAQFDVVVAVFIQFADPGERDRIFAGMKRAARPGGLLLLEGYRPEQIAYGTGGPSAVENLYTEDLLRDAFADFEILDLASYDAEVREGSGHSGTSALIDLVARKPQATPIGRFASAA